MCYGHSTCTMAIVRRRLLYCRRTTVCSCQSRRLSSSNCHAPKVLQLYIAELLPFPFKRSNDHTHTLASGRGLPLFNCFEHATPQRRNSQISSESIRVAKFEYRLWRRKLNARVALEHDRLSFGTFCGGAPHVKSNKKHGRALCKRNGNCFTTFILTLCATWSDFECKVKTLIAKRSLPNEC